MTRKTLKSFQLGEMLGVGTVGTIHRAVDRVSRREVALKILQPAVSQDPTIRLRFEREIEVLHKLNHPNVVACYDHGLDNKRLFYSMEVVDGGTLKEILAKRGRLRVEEVLECGWQLCSALQYIHNHGIVHRDLKPSNIYLTQSGLIKLGDFGIALDTGAVEITDQGLTVGSYLYMSPEQIRGDRSISYQTDLYALGCLLFELVTGEPPFQGDNFARIFDQHLSTEPPSARRLAVDCPEVLDELIRSLLSKDPDDRPINARSVQGILAETLSELTGPEVIDTLKMCHRTGSRRLERLIAPARLEPNEVSWSQLIMAAAAIALLVCLASIVKLFGG
ncbi:MAG: serine/threonine-protein kinase [Planctomycetota bacterium]|nr:serine/threonine-protein kinase [Planctomycetota bacterium]MDA1162010.1 serine/threonine-protein kinase [Planctomycetota bacterium]